MPELHDLSDLGTEVTNLARDTAYVVVGLGVLGLQKAQVQRVELQNRLGQDPELDERLAHLRTALYAGVKHVDEIVESAFTFVESTLEPLEEQLPAGAREVSRKARSQVREVHSQIREAVVPVA
ncbi:MAG: hypothetical protein ACLP9C_01995 [Acidimicrobiales bacterium]